MCSQNDDPSQHDDTLRAALVDVLRVFDAPFSTSPEQRRRIRERAERALAASATDEPKGTLRAAAQAVVDEAEPDWGDEGWVDYLVPHEKLDALRAALAASATGPDVREPTDAEAELIALYGDRAATPATGPDVERDAAIEEVIDAAIEINDVLSVRLSNALAGLDRFIATPATGPLTDEQIEAIYAAFDVQTGNEARTIEGKRRIVEPIYEAVVASMRAGVQKGPRYGGLATPATGPDAEAAAKRAYIAGPYRDAFTNGWNAALAASATEQDTAQLDWRDSR